MKIQFNEAQLSRAQQKSLIEVLDVLQAENENEVEVTVVEFPLKLMVKLDDDIGMMLGWNADKECYAGITEPDLTEPVPKPESQKDTVDLPEPEPDLSPVVVRVHALARTFSSLAKPLSSQQRFEMGIEFCRVLFKELLE